MPPVPKRNSESMRHPSSDAPAADKIDLESVAGRQVVAPASDPKWHPLATEWFESLKESLQIAFYEPSDWASAKIMAEQLSRCLKPRYVGVDSEGNAILTHQPMNGSEMTAFIKAWTSLLVTEGERRRMRLEIHREQVTAQAPGVVPDMQNVVPMEQSRRMGVS